MYGGMAGQAATAGKGRGMTIKIDRPDEKSRDYYSDIARYKVKPLTNKTLIQMRDDAWNWRMLNRMAAETHMYCNGKFVFRIAKGSGLIPKKAPTPDANETAQRQPLKAMFVLRTRKVVAMSVIGVREHTSELIYYALSSSRHRPNARLSFVNASYYATIMARFPDAVLFWFPRLKSEPRHTPLRFAEDGKIVALLMEVGNETLKQPRDIICAATGD